MDQQDDFYIQIIGTQVWDPMQDNVDVEVRLADGRRFGATFFTLHNLERLFEKNRTTGECAAGLYLWATNMILVRELSIEAVKTTVRDLMTNGEFDKAFSVLDDEHG
jgi:hypothetical protein